MNQQHIPPEALTAWHRWKALGRQMSAGRLVNMDELFAARNGYFRALDAAGIPWHPADLDA